MTILPRPGMQQDAQEVKIAARRPCGFHLEIAMENGENVGLTHEQFGNFPLEIVNHQPCFFFKFVHENLVLTTTMDRLNHSTLNTWFVHSCFVVSKCLIYVCST